MADKEKPDGLKLSDDRLVRPGDWVEFRKGGRLLTEYNPAIDLQATHGKGPFLVVSINNEKSTLSLEGSKTKTLFTVSSNFLVTAHHAFQLQPA